MPSLAPDFSNRLLLGAPRPIDNLRGCDELPEHGNRVGVTVAECVRDVDDTVSDFDCGQILDEAGGTHSRLLLKRPAAPSLPEQASIIQHLFDSQAADVNTPSHVSRGWAA